MNLAPYWCFLSLTQLLELGAVMPLDGATGLLQHLLEPPPCRTTCLAEPTNVTRCHLECHITCTPCILGIDKDI